MTKKQPGTGGAGGQGDTAKDLRERAEEIVRVRRASDKPLPEKEGLALHELRVHQTELEMQNEELRQTQGELEISRSKYFDLYNLAPAGYFTISEKNIILEANLTAANLLGMERQALTGQPFTRLIVPGDQDIYYLFRKNLFETGTPQSCDVRMARPDGGLLWARMQAALAGDATGGALTYNAVIADITEAKQAEEAMRRSEEKYRNLIGAAQEGIWVIDKDSRTTFANPRMAQMLGYTVEDMNGKPIFSFMDEQGVEIAKEHVERRKQGISGQHDFELIKKDGARLYCAIASSPLFKGGDYIGAIAGIIDITERKAAEEELQRFFNLVPDMVCVASAEGYFLKINPMWQKTLGYTEQELFAAPFIDFIHPDDRDATMKEVERQIGGEATIEFVNRYRCKDGGYKWLEWMSTPSPDKKQLFAAARDITERKAAEDKAKQFPKMLLEFQEKERARIAAELHDSLAQNMLVISNEIKLALKALPAGSPLSEKLASSSKLALRTMDEILEIAHDLRPSHLDQLGLEKAVDSLAQRVARLLGIYIDVEIRLDGNTITPEMEINIFRIIQEGLNNIMKHSKAKNAFIDLGASNNSLMLTITDDGKGFDAAGDGSGGFGIMGMIKRAKILNGGCKIQSCGEGTVISVVIPPHPPPRRRAIAGPCG